MAYSHDEETEIVRKAMLLETAIAIEKVDLADLKSEEFDRFPDYETVFQDKRPVAPQRETCTVAKVDDLPIPKPPKCDYTLKQHCIKQPYWVVMLLVGFLLMTSSRSSYMFGMFLGAVGMYGLPITYFRKKRELNKELAESPQYLTLVDATKMKNLELREAAEKEAKEKQVVLDKKYEKELAHYNSVVIPSYEATVADHKHEYEKMQEEYSRDKAEWEENKAKTIALLSEDISAKQESLAKLYDETKILSVHYREIPLLEWLYDDMRTSDHDIRYATELLDRNRQRVAQEEGVDRVRNCINILKDETKNHHMEMLGALGVIAGTVQGVESSLLEANASLGYIYDVNKKTLGHARVNTGYVAVKEWRRHKEESR